MSTPSRIVRWLARTACWLFYRVDQAGSPPPAGPLLLLANHANALLDPAVIWTTAARDVRFLAKSTLFAGPFRPFLAGAGAIPVYRRRDEGVDMSRNADMFRAVDAALAAGDAVCIFPEGMSHSRGRLIELRTGAARIVFAAEAAGTAVQLVAVGLNFERKTRFRSRVTVAYGPPFRASDLMTTDEHGQADAVRALTDRIAGHMRRLLIEADPGADARLVERVAQLYSAARGGRTTPEERIARRRAIAKGMEQLRASEAGRYEELLVRVRRYDGRLRRFGLRDRHLDLEVSRADALRFGIREGLLAIPLVPIALAGLVLFFVPYWATAIIARLATRESDVAASAKVIGGAIVYVVWLAAIVGALWWLKSPAAALMAGVTLPLLAVAGLFAIERESAVLDAIRAWLFIRRGRTGTRVLRRERSELADVFDDVYAWLQAHRPSKAITSPASDPTASSPS